MKAKLIKVDDGYMLYIDNILYASDVNPYVKLSLKNCQAIERGYNLDELAHIRAEILNSYTSGTKWADEIDKLLTRYREVIELMGDKKFTLEDMMNCWNKALTFQTHKKTLGEHIQSLQQTEWDVEVEMWFHGTRHKKGEWMAKLDAEGCLILKPKSE